MSIFCTRCGTAAADDAAFCENCGAALTKATAPAVKPPVVDPQPEVSGVKSLQTPKVSRKVLLMGLSVIALLACGTAAAYLLLQPPAPTRDRLMAAAKAAYGDKLIRERRQELCLSNMSYDNQPMNIGQFDNRTQEWLNVLVAAGLYQPGQPVSSGGYFPQTLIQYQPTPELANWLDGQRLCVAKSVTLADITDIGEPKEFKLGRGEQAYTTKALKAKQVFLAEQTAPWLNKPEVREAVLARLSDWTFEDQKLRKVVTDSFALEQGQWATGPELQHKLQRDLHIAQRAQEDSPRATQGMSGWMSKLGQLFSFGGHPLKGAWRIEMDGLAGAFTRGIDARVVFTNNTMEAEGKVLKCEFEVDGSRVIVRPEGESAGMVFVMEDADTASLDTGFVKMKYRRVK